MRLEKKESLSMEAAGGDGKQQCQSGHSLGLTVAGNSEPTSDQETTKRAEVP